MAFFKSRKRSLFLKIGSNVSLIFLTTLSLRVFPQLSNTSPQTNLEDSRSEEPGLDSSIFYSFDGYGEDFLQGNSLLLRNKPVKSTPTKLHLPSSSKMEKPSVSWLRKNYPILEERAIDDPSQENIEAYLYTKRILLDKAQNFSNKVSEVSKSDPFLNENNRIPYASVGATSINNANVKAQQDAVRQMAENGGVYVFIDGRCFFCEKQLPILSYLKTAYGLEHLIISVDGTKPRDFRGSAIPDNGLFTKLGLKLTPSIVYVNHPRPYLNGQDLNNYLIISQGFYAADELVKVMAYAAYKTDLINSITKKDLGIWDRGLASSHDLSNLLLDASSPGSFKERIQPMLESAYK
jgi:conjugal transfer pilus assembly protein TraF